jgi:hypothetical protein
MEGSRRVALRGSKPARPSAVPSLAGRCEHISIPGRLCARAARRSRVDFISSRRQSVPRSGRTPLPWCRYSQDTRRDVGDTSGIARFHRHAKKAPHEAGPFFLLRPACYFLAGGVAGTARVAGVALVAGPPLFGVALVAGTAGVAFVAGGVAAVTAKVAAANTTAVRASSGLVMHVLLNGWRNIPRIGDRARTMPVHAKRYIFHGSRSQYSPC